ncbi:transport and golgi organization 2 [Rhynchophorus ferrugineus]|uniref:transport and golgi organization 2 n=1 Tax=Rhynchophorus ferrugineus TaxID=354439 RepID=UPI003FCD8087
MCILFVHTNPKPEENEYRLIIATNRDEFYKRPAQPVYQCPETKVIAGRDMEPGREGGSWLGFKSKINSKTGETMKHCFSCLTNISNCPKVDNPTGRGRLVIDYLESELNYPEYVKLLSRNGLRYSGYNLVAVELSIDGSIQIYHHSNFPQIDSVYDGKHTLGFGNSPVSSPYMKVFHGKERFEDIIQQNFERTKLKNELLSLLKDPTKYLPDKELERRSVHALEKLSSIFVDFKEAGYGTRTHTIILIDKEWNLEFTEVTLEEPIDVDNLKWNTRVIKRLL